MSCELGCEKLGPELLAQMLSDFKFEYLKLYTSEMARNNIRKNTRRRLLTQTFIRVASVQMTSYWCSGTGTSVTC